VTRRGVVCLLGIVLAAFAGLGCGPSRAQSPMLSITGKGTQASYPLTTLLGRPDTLPVTVEDPIYRRAMSYRAVPVAALMKDMNIGVGDYVQARAIDNFSVAIPDRLLRAPGAPGIEAFMALEDPAAPWPAIPGKADKRSAGPFYIVWKLTPPATVSREYWAYRLAALAVAENPVTRWPVLAVGLDVPANDPIRNGLDRFVEMCLACHRFRGAGEGDQGPDLGQPMNPVDYLQPVALKKMIRDPTSVRRWPDQKMPGFDEAALSDRDLDAIIAWLSYKARQSR
jgi:mono/diheme cytochrome c family protein